LAVSNEGNRGRKHHVGDTKSTRGSPLWMAPERIVNKIIKEKELMEELKNDIEGYKKRVGIGDKDKAININMSEKSDVYSFGVMFWEMLTQNWPFVDLITTESYTELFSIILSGKRPSLKGVDAELAQIIEQCWQPNPDKRPRFSEVVVLLQNALITLELPTSSCPDAATFWTTHWTVEASSVRVADLVQELAVEKYITEEMKETVLVCMYGLLTGKVIELPPNIAHYKVTLKDFGNIIKWFGPLKQGGIMNMVQMMQTAYFFGLIEKTEVDNILLMHRQDKTYLVRLNTGANMPISQAPFVISIYSKGKKGAGTCLHIRVFPRVQGSYGKWVCQAGKEKVKGDSLTELIDNLRTTSFIIEPLVPNPFAPLWSSQAAPSGRYGADPDIMGLTGSSSEGS